MNIEKSNIDFNAKKGFICDMNGVIYHGNQILPGVPEFIQWLHDEKKEYLFLTNNSGYTPRELNQKLARMGLDTLTQATNLVLKGARLIGANSDVSGPIENGIAPACRALIAPIEMATGTKAYFCGKPNPLMMRTGLNMLGCHSAQAVMIGDRMDTDVISGMESGMSTVLVLSGCSTRDTLKMYAYRPTMVLNGVGDIPARAKSKAE